MNSKKLMMVVVAVLFVIVSINSHLQVQAMYDTGERISDGNRLELGGVVVSLASSPFLSANNYGVVDSALTDLDLSLPNMSGLVWLNVSGNRLTTLDVNNTRNLMTLIVSENYLLS